MSEHPDEQSKYKRKRKKSFLKNARKYAKKGCYGRGSQLDADTYQYFVRIMEAYKEGFPSEDEKRKFCTLHFLKLHLARRDFLHARRDITSKCQTFQWYSLTTFLNKPRMRKSTVYAIRLDVGSWSSCYLSPTIKHSCGT